MIVGLNKDKHNERLIKINYPYCYTEEGVPIKRGSIGIIIGYSIIFGIKNYVVLIQGGFAKLPKKHINILKNS